MELAGGCNWVGIALGFYLCPFKHIPVFYSAFDGGAVDPSGFLGMVGGFGHVGFVWFFFFCGCCS